MAARGIRPKCSAVIVAAGSSSRMGGTDKLTSMLGGKCVLRRTLEAFQTAREIDEIIVVVREDRVEEFTKRIDGWKLSKVKRVTAGGSDRTGSTEAGLACVARDAKLVAVHDGARPLVSTDVIGRTVLLAVRTLAAAPAVPVTDTIKVVSEGIVTATPDRATLFAVQTPQVFAPDLLRAALTRARETGAVLTDDCSAVEGLGVSVRLCEGDRRNIKITTQEDLLVAEAFLKEESNHADRTRV